MSILLEFSSYNFGEQEELCLKTGKQHPHQILLIPPLFDEMNRLRRMIVHIMTLLDAHQIGCILPDLPGTNESLLPQEQSNLTLWREALLECASQQGNRKNIASFRGGCLIDVLEGNFRNWRFAPAKGQSLVRTMMRTRIASDKESGLSTTMAELSETLESEPVNLAGNIISQQMFSELQSATPEESDDLRTARLETDSLPADVKLPGSTLWLRAEPSEDSTLSTAIAADLATWARM